MSLKLLSTTPEALPPTLRQARRWAGQQGIAALASDAAAASQRSHPLPPSASSQSSSCCCPAAPPRTAALQELQALLQAAQLQGYMRPGCVHLTLDAIAEVGGRYVGGLWVCGCWVWLGGWKPSQAWTLSALPTQMLSCRVPSSWLRCSAAAWPPLCSSCWMTPPLGWAACWAGCRRW